MSTIVDKLMSTTVDILSFNKHLYNQFLKVKYAFNLKTLIYVGTPNFTNQGLAFELLCLYLIYYTFLIINILL